MVKVLLINNIRRVLKKRQYGENSRIRPPERKGKIGQATQLKHLIWNCSIWGNIKA